jgi:hypothetical protein
MIKIFDIRNSITRLIFDYRYTLVVVLSMAMSLAISLFLYAQVYSINYKPLPFENPDNIVNIGRSENGYTFPSGLHYFDIAYFAEHQKTLDDFCGYYAGLLIVETSRVTERIQTAVTSSNLFRISGVPALIGRTLLSSDDASGAPQVAVLGYEIWERFFDKSDNVIGKRISVEGAPVTVVGVMPQGFKFPVDQNIWVSWPAADPSPNGDGWATVIGRLKPGITLAQARDEFKTLANDLVRFNPQLYKTKSVNLDFYTKVFSRYMQLHSNILSLVAFAVLLMGCFSVANLLIVRILEHSKDSLIKVALGLPA